MVNLPSWQRFLILAVIVLGAFFALPNAEYSRVENYNDANARIAAGKAEPGDEALAQSWPSWLPNDIVNLGLDLRGGVHMVVRVETADVYAERYDSLWVTARDLLRERRDLYGEVSRVASDDGLVIRIGNSSTTDQAMEELRATARALGADGVELSIENNDIRIDLTPAAKAQIDDLTMARSLEIVRRRIDGAGTKEPSIARLGENRIVIDVPGFGSVEEVQSVIGKTAKLTLHPVYEFTNDGEQIVDFDQLLLPLRDGGFAILDRAAVVSGDMITNAQPGFDQANQPTVNFNLNTQGAKLFGDYTSGNIGEPFAIVLDGEIISAPTIRGYIPGGSAMISGVSLEESQSISVLLRAGALPAELVVLEQSVVGPDLGQDSIDAGTFAAMIALLAVAVYMIISYRSFGAFAVFSLAVNMILIVAGLSLLGSVLTLPGIAGIVLTIGMAVDANVLIFERIREEYKANAVLIRAIDQGFARALGSIIDANVTTFIAALVLYIFGAGPVRGFSITLMIGIVTSVFTAIFCTRLLVVWYLDWRKPKTLGY